MKQKKEKKLGLGKETVQDLLLDRDDQGRVKGGSQQQYVGTTQIPIYC